MRNSTSRTAKGDTTARLRGCHRRAPGLRLPLASGLALALVTLQSTTTLAVSLSAAGAKISAIQTQRGERAAGSVLFATLPVTSCADDDGSGTLRSIVAGAASGDIVDLSALDCGTITLTSGQIEVHVDDLTVLGPGRDALTIDGNNAGRLFFHDGAGTLTLSSLTLAHGRADNGAANPTPTLLAGASGGCVFSRDAGGNFTSKIALTDATVTGCEAFSSAAGTGSPAFGGAVYAGNSITLVRSTISNNKATQAGSASGAFGGGLGSILGSIVLTDSIVSGNSASTTYNGGLVHVDGGGLNGRHVIVSGSTIENNFAGCETGGTCTSHGGGITTGSDLSITKSSVVGNRLAATDTVRGAGIYGSFSNPNQSSSISDTTIGGNSATSSGATSNGGPSGGGGLFAWSSSVAISGSTISGNSAPTGGGIFADYYGTAALTLADSTVSGNSAANAGGVYLGHSSGYYGNSTPPAVIRSSTITANSSSAVNAAGGVVDKHPSGGPSTFQSTIVAGNTAAAPAAADLTVALGSITGANNLILAAAGVTLPSGTLSTDPQLGPLQDNGGRTFTHALQPGSPAIDAGNNASGLPFDQRGSGYRRVVGAAADIGAFEVQSGVTPPTLLKSFTPSSIPPGPPEVISTLTITLGNSNTSAATLNSALTDLLPSPVVVAGTPNAATSCPGGIVTAMPASGSVTLAAGAWIPAAGTCTITVAVSSTTEGTFTNSIPAGALRTDAGSNVDPATANLTVSAAAALPPVAMDDHYTLRGNTTLTVAAPGVLGNDYDPQGGIIAVAPGLLGRPQAGVVSMSYASGAFSYAPIPGFVGADHFDYQLENSWFTLSNTATVWLTVTAPNQPPVATDDSYSTPANTTLTVDAAHGVLANDSDPDGDALTARIVNTAPAGTLFLYPDGHLLYIPPNGFVGTVQFTYEANDGFADSNLTTVMITVGDSADRIFANGFDP